MQLLSFRHLWGVTDSLPAALERFARLGYVGIEAVLPADVGAFRESLAEFRLKVIPLHQSEGKSAADHLRSLRDGIARAKSVSPIMINVHGGADRFSLDESLTFFREAIQIEKGEGVPLAFETHRGRVLYNPWRTAEVLEAVPEMKLCADYSHWCVVCERLLGSTEESILDLCASRVLHVHTRVGYSQGPQVPDPAAPEYKDAIEAHEKWWRQIWSSQRELGFTATTFTPEFGPAPYLQSEPGTQKPLADLATVCEWTKGRVESTFADWVANRR